MIVLYSQWLIIITPQCFTWLFDKLLTPVKMTMHGLIRCDCSSLLMCKYVICLFEWFHKVLKVGVYIATESDAAIVSVK